jgi:hypothetical protein
MKGLLIKNKTKRLTVEDVLKHEYFDNYKFNDILDLTFFSPLKAYSIKLRDCLPDVKGNNNNKEFKFDVSLSPINKSLPFNEFNIFYKLKND